MDLPPPIAALIEGSQAHRETIGRSAASVHRLLLPDNRILFLKHQAAGPLGELSGEAERLRWLAAQGIDCPGVVAFETWQGRDWLLMDPVRGVDLVAAMGTMSGAAIVASAAQGLQQLHALDIASCPFDHRWDRRVARAQEHLLAGLVDPEDFDGDRLGLSPEEVFADLSALDNPERDLVVTHGDACLPNLMAVAEGFSGFVDCGRLGVADRYQDLSLVCRSIAYNLGGAFVPLFLEAYGIDRLDEVRLRAYRMLDEFF